jgi:FAD:protein FMN transferase
MFERISVCLAFLIGLETIHSDVQPPVFEKYQFESPQMGIPFRLVLHTDLDKAQVAVAASAVWRRISDLNAVLSNYETDSELSRLGYHSGQGKWTEVSDDFWDVITEAQRLSVISEGAFDFTLGPATALWRKVRREKRLPSHEILSSMMNRTGWQRLVLNPENQSVCLTGSGMRLDPGGIAKGFALDEGMKVLESFGITRALLSGGGDIVVLDAPLGTDGWQIRLADFQQGTDPTDIIELSRSAIATSGDLFQFVEIEGRRYSHILDPKTGIGLTRRMLVSVIAPTGMEADSLATTLSVLGPEKAPGWLTQHAPMIQVRMLWMDATEKIHQWQTESFGGLH